MKKKIVLIGGGGHCRSVADCLVSLEIYDEIGIVEKEAGAGSGVQGIDIIGMDADLQRLFDEGWRYAFVTIGSVGNTLGRRKILQNLKEIGFEIPNIIDRTAVIGKDVILGEGIFVGKNAVINAGTTIGDCAIINTGAVVEHDCKIGDFAHISSGAVLCGEVNIGDDTHVGAGTVIRQQIKVGSKVLLGIGSVVVKNVPDSVTGYGNPCKW